MPSNHLPEGNCSVSKSASTLQQSIQLAEVQVEDEQEVLEEVEHYVDEREGVYRKENEAKT